MIETLEDLHLTPNARLVTLDLFLRNHLEGDLAGDVMRRVGRTPIRMGGEV
jgi:hypothetical protein